MGISAVGTTQKIGGVDKTPSYDTTIQAQARQNLEPKQNSVVAAPSDKGEQNTLTTTNEKLQRIASAMADYIESIGRDLRIRIDDKTDHVVIQVISKSTGKVIRQVPPEELLKLAARMEEMVGVFFDNSA